MEAREPDGECTHRSDADDPHRLRRLDPGAPEGLDDARPRLHERGRSEGHVVGQRVEDPRGDDDELAPAAGAREADGVVALTEVRVAGAAAGQLMQPMFPSQTSAGPAERR